MEKKIHFYWGNSNMSWLRYMTIESFVKHNPDWRVVLTLDKSTTSKNKWSDENKQDFFNYEGEDYTSSIDSLGVEIRTWEPELVPAANRTEVLENGSFFTNVPGDMDLDVPRVPELSTPSHRSNFFKWYTLATEGGVYSDMDIIFTAPIGDNWACIDSHDATLCWDDGYYLIGFMASQGDSELFSKIYKSAHIIFDEKKYQSVGQAALLYSIANNPNIEYTYSDILQYFNGAETVFLFDPNLVYPVRYGEIARIFPGSDDECSIPASSIGVHWFGGCAPGQVFNNQVSRENFLDKPCALSSALKKGII